MQENHLKKKLRELKKQEKRIRHTEHCVMWDRYFSDQGQYPLKALLTMTDERRKSIFEDYFMSIYLLYYRENGQPITQLCDPALLSIFGLSSFATFEDVKKRFRELAHRHHPDKGGNIDTFRMYLDVYEQIKDYFPSE